MIKDRLEVSAELEKRVLRGYDPLRDPESSEDADADWMVLDEEEFCRIKNEAIRKKNVLCGS